MGQESAKKAAAKGAAKLIESKMIVGLGSGSTAAFFIEALAHRAQTENLQIKAAVASSRRSAELGERLGLPIQDLNDICRVDLTVDGADEIDPEKRLIKGRGGAHVREKILAAASSEMIVIADETKLVDRLGVGVLPVEIVGFGAPATRMKVEDLGYKCAWRQNPDGSLYLSDNGNLLLDLSFEAPLSHPEAVQEELIHLPGVVDTGFFFQLAGRILIGYPNCSFEVR